jgi:hypothetical protein
LYNGLQVGAEMLFVKTSKENITPDANLLA